MFHMTRNDEADTAVSNVRDRARQAVAQVKPVADRVKPVTDRVKPVADRVRPVAAQVKPAARTAGAAAGRGVHRTRAWAAPQLEHGGQVLQDTVAPKVSALLSSAAQAVEPAKPPRRRWRKVVAISMLMAAAGAVVAVLRNRRKLDFSASADESDADSVTPAAQMPAGPDSTSPEANANGQDSASAEADANGQAKASADAANGQVRTS
jgi:hypothetical protein